MNRLDWATIASFGDRLMRSYLTLSLLLLASDTLIASPSRYLEDATLRSVQFIDAQEGWSVGDDGAIWHSMDAGATWERQPSGTRASLRHVHFLTPYSGWAVGRVEMAEGKSVGVILFTSDGGLKWNSLASNTLPGLNYVKFFTEREGVAVGDGSDASPSGVFRTEDGGRTWKALPGARASSWLAADFIDSRTGSLAGHWGTLAVVNDSNFVKAQVDSLGGRAVRSVKTQAGTSFAVGQGGLVLKSSNSSGIRWGFVDLKLPDSLLASIDFHAVALKGKHVWIVGRPGSLVFHSSDGGATWEQQSTGQSIPLHSIHFDDENQGWAVGEMGTVVTTQDGGKKWKVVRQEGQRAAALLVQTTRDGTQLDLAAKLGLGEGYRLVGCRVTSEDSASTAPKDALDPERLAYAFRNAGGTTTDSLWQFPLAKVSSGIGTEQLLRGWDALHGEQQSAQAILRQLVLAIRVWRPEVIVAENRGDSPVGQLILESWVEAFKRAADPNAYPEQLSTLKLETWSAKKLYVMQPRLDPTAVKFDAGEVLPPLENSPREFVFEAERILDPKAEPSAERSYRLLGSRLSGATTHANLFDGIELVPGATARRRLPPESEEDQARAKELAKHANAQMVLLKLGKPESSDLANPAQTMSLIDKQLKELPMQMAASAAYKLGTSYAAAGRWFLARETFIRLIDRYPGHPLSLEAARWLIRFHTSSETRRREELGNFVVSGQTSFQGIASQEEAGNTKINGSTAVKSEQKFHEIDRSKALKGWLDESLKLERQLFAHGPLMGRDPAIQLCLQSAKRQLGKLDDVKKWSVAYLAESSALISENALPLGADPWRDCVLTESWLLNRTSALNAPKPLGMCRTTRERPHLDGKLNDSCWLEAKALPMKNATGPFGPDYATLSSPSDAFLSFKRRDINTVEAPTQAVFSHDAEYLYIGVQCFHPEGKQVPAVEKRTRDMQLDDFDRVSIMIDLDRDYQTYFQLNVDQRGAVAEDCWGDRTWNPKWFVAVHREERGWSAEIAIPLVELSSDTPTQGRVWACNVTRTIPGQGTQSWSIPSGVEPRPEGMGLLQFVGEVK